MRHNRYLRPNVLLAAFLVLMSAAPLTWSQDSAPGFVLETEFGPGWQSRNDVQIPNDSLGTKFALDDISGSGPWLTARLNLLWDINEKHGVRVLLAPLAFEETGALRSDVDFAGGDFQASEPVEARYKFNSWRVSWRYHSINRDRWDLWLGATLKIRDAEIRLTQGQVTATDDDVGFVPLFYLASRYRLGERWTFNAELDALAGGPGRAIDLGLRPDYDVNSRWTVGAGYRGLEGGADTDDVYNFAWFNSFVFSTRYSF